MAEEVASLSINVNTESVRKAVVNFEDMVDMARQVENSLKKLGNANQSLTILAREIENASKSLSGFIASGGGSTRQLEELDKKAVQLNQAMAAARSPIEKTGESLRNAFGTVPADNIKAIASLSVELNKDIARLGKTADDFFESGRNSQVKDHLAEIFEEVARGGDKLNLAEKDFFGLLSQTGEMLKKEQLSISDLTDGLGQYLPKALNISADAMGTTTENLKRLAAEGKLAASDLLPQLAKALNETSDNAEKLGNETATLGQKIFTFVKTAGITAGVGKLVNVYADFWQATNEAKERLDALDASFRNAFGGQATRLLAGVKDQCRELGLGFQATAALAHDFFEQGKNTSIASEMDKIFNSVTTAGRALQLTDDQIKGTLNGIAELSGKDSIRLDELSDKLGQHLPNALGISARAMNMTIAELAEFAAQGKLAADEYLPNLARALTDEYAQAAREAADTVDGMTMRMASAWEEFKANLAHSGPAKFVVQFVTQGLENANQAIDKAKETKAAKTILANSGIIPAGKETFLGYEIYGSSDYSQDQIDHVSAALKTKDIAKNIASEITKEGERAIAQLGSAYGKTRTGKVDTFEAKRKEIKQNYDRALSFAKSQGASEKTLNDLKKQYEAINKDIDTAEKRYNKLLSGSSSKASKAAAASYRAAAAQEDYTSKIAQAAAEAKKLELQLNRNATAEQRFALEKERIEAEYEAEIQKNAKERMSLSDKISASELEKYKIAQDKVALLNKELKLEESRKNAGQKNVQIAQGQIKFYKELGQLSGGYIDDLDLQKTLIAQQAEEYSKSYQIADDLVAKWQELQLLQASNDPFDGAYRGLLKFNAEMANSGSQWEEISYNFGKNFMSTTRSMFDDFLESGKTSFDGFRNLFKQLLKDLAWQAIAQPIMLSVIGGVTGSATGSGVAQAASGQSMIASASADGSSIASQAASMGGKYALNQLMGGSNGGIIGSITNSINTAVGEMFPSLFAANSTINSAINTQANLFAHAGIQTAATGTLPATTFTSALGTAGIGAGLGAMASPFVNNLLGLQNNTGSQVGSLVGGGLGTLGGAMIAASAIPGAGWIAGGIAALGSLLGGGIGSLFGGGQQELPELYLASGVNLWERYDKDKSGETTYGGEPSFHGNGLFSWGTGAQGTDYWTAYGPVASIFNVLESGQKTANAFEDALRGVDDALGDQFIQSLQDMGRITNDVYYEGKDISQENLQNYINSISTNIQGKIIGALSTVDLTPLTIAADGFAADTAEEVGQAISKILSYASIGDVIEDEKLKEQFADNYIDQMTHALDNVSLAPLAIAADGLAVDTVDELSSALTDVFAAYDMAETINDEEIKAAYQAKMQSIIERAFDDIDLSFLRVDFDKNSFAGLQQAYAATQAWQTVTQSLEDIINPASEFDATMDAARNQFDDWIGKLQELGWQEEAIAEIEARRIDYMRKYQEELEKETRQNLSLRLSALRNGSDSNLYAIHSLLYQQANERENWRQKYGEEHELYQTGVGIQRAELIQTLIDQLKGMREGWLEQERQASQERLREQQSYLQEQIAALQLEIQARQKEISEADRLADTWRRIGKSLEDYRRDLWTSQNNLMGTRYEEAYSQFDSIYQKALAGDEEAFNKLTSKASELLQLGRDELPQAGEYDDLFYEVDQKLKHAQEYASKQLTEAERQADYLQRELEALQAQQDALDAENEILAEQLDALNAQTEAIYECKYSLDELNGAIGYLEAALQRQTAPEKYYDYDSLLAEKAANMNKGLTLGIGQTAGGWTPQKVLEEIRDRGMTVSQWYELWGKQEGYVLHAAKTTNDTLNYEFGSLDRNLRQNFDDNSHILNESLLDQLKQLEISGLDLNSLLGTEIENWPQALLKIDTASTSICGAISAMGSSIASAIKSASVQEEESYRAASTKASSGAASKGSGSASLATAASGTASKISSAAASANKTSATSASTSSASKAPTAGTATTINIAGHTVSGTATGKGSVNVKASDILAIFNNKYADGGIAPANRMFLVGEEGPEVLMSPKQWGVLDNESTKKLLGQEEPVMPIVMQQSDNDALEAIGAGLEEVSLYLRQLIVKSDEAAHASQKMAQILSLWESAGLPEGKPA